MSDVIRTLIDFATGDNWEMPLSLYERYQKECVEGQLTVPSGMTCIQFWLTTLTEEERKTITRKN
jgi:hypothetical protein